MTFDEWLENKYGKGNFNTVYSEDIVREAWDAAKADIENRLATHTMVSVYEDAYEGDEWDEIGTTPEKEVKKIIGE